MRSAEIATARIRAFASVSMGRRRRASVADCHFALVRETFMRSDGSEQSAPGPPRGPISAHMSVSTTHE